jgi:hypothetical protein
MDRIIPTTEFPFSETGGANFWKLFHSVPTALLQDAVSAPSSTLTLVGESSVN